LINMNSKSIVVIVSLICSIFSITLSAGFAAAENPAAAGPFSAKTSVPAGTLPLFSVAVGNDSPEKLGEPISAEDPADYDIYTLPASFQTFEKLGFIIVLDSIKNRLCKYSTSGKFLYAIELPFYYHAIDFTWFQNSRRVFVAFQDRPQIGVFDMDFTLAKPVASNNSILDLSQGAASDDFYAQTIWPCNAADTSEDCLVVNLSSCPDADYSVYSYKSGKMVKITDIRRPLNNLAAALDSRTAIGVFSDTDEAKLIKQDLLSGKSVEYALPKEFSKKDTGTSCYSLKVAGCDSNGDVYLEALFGGGESTTDSDIIKFGRDGKFAGRTDIFPYPEMLTNRHISIDAAGAVYFMKFNEAKDEIEFYRFEVK